MATIKAFSDLFQSKKLAEILPLESADMTYYACVKDWKGNPVPPKWSKPVALTKEELALPCSNFQKYEYVLCWSLAALLSVLPKIQGGKPIIALDDNYITYPHISDLHTKADNLVDACYEMIIKLHEQNFYDHGKVSR